MEDYEQLKSIILIASPKHVFRSCPDCGENLYLNELRKVYFCKECSYTQKDETEAENLTRIINLLDVIVAIGKLKSINYGVGEQGELVKLIGFGQPSEYTSIFWDLDNDDLDLQSDEMKQFLIDTLLK